MKFPRSTIRLMHHISIGLQEILVSFTVLLNSVYGVAVLYSVRWRSVCIYYYYFIEDKTKYVLVAWRAFCGHFCLLVPGYNLNFRFLRTWSIYFFVFVVFVCMGLRMDKMSAKSLIICQHIINLIQERFVGQAKSSNCFYVYGFESNNQFVV